MFEYLVLNEDSLPFKSITVCNNYLSEFFKILISAHSNGIKPLRVSNNFGKSWYHILLSENYYFKDWLAFQDRNNKDLSRRIKSLISKSDFPQIPSSFFQAKDQYERSEFRLYSNPSIPTTSLGIAFLIDGLAISFLSDETWDHKQIIILQRKINLSNQIVEHKRCVDNSTRIVHWNEHLNKIQKQRRNNYKKGKILWENRRKEFPNLVFCHDIKKTFLNLSIGDVYFNRLLENLKILNDVILLTRSDTELKSISSLDFSDESKDVKHDPKLNKYRMFTLPENNERVFFGLHLKYFPENFRLHFYPDYTSKKVYIGYFGKHLPLRK